MPTVAPPPRYSPEYQRLVAQYEAARKAEVEALQQQIADLQYENFKLRTGTEQAEKVIAGLEKALRKEARIYL